MLIHSERHERRLTSRKAQVGATHPYRAWSLGNRASILYAAHTETEALQAKETADGAWGRAADPAAPSMASTGVGGAPPMAIRVLVGEPTTVEVAVASWKA